jgi:hypothetical protein
MDKLEKLYEAVDMLESLELPVSYEQRAAIAQMEKEYLRDEIIPLMKQELEPLIKNMRNRFSLSIKYSKESGVSIELTEALSLNQKSTPSNDDSGYRKKKYILRVVFPNNTVSCHKTVSKTFVDVVEYAGVKNVERLGIMVLGENIISSKKMENERYASGQYETQPGLYISTYCDTDKKYDILKTINRELDLNLKIEKVMLD